MGARITATDTILGNVQTSLDGTKSRVEQIMNFLANVDKYNVTYSFALYGTVLGLSVLSLLGIIFVKCFNMIQCRYLLYTICLICFFVCLLLFFLSITLSVAMASAWYSCTYLSTSFTTPTGFTSLIDNVVGSQYGDLSTYFSECFGGTNDFITVTDATLSGYITQLKTAVFNSAQYNFTDMTTNINNKLSALSNEIDNTGLGSIPDFDVTTTNGQS